MGKKTAAALIVIIFLLLLSAGLLFYQNRKLVKNTPSPQPTTVTQTIADSKEVSQPSPSSSPSPKLTLKLLQENISAGLNSQNYQALSTYMTNPVNLSLMSTECCQPQTPDEAAKQLEYVKDAEPFDFNQQNPIIKNLKSKNSQLAQAFIGLSTGGEKLAAFTIDTNNKISAIQLSISYKLYTQ